MSSQYDEENNINNEEENIEDDNIQDENIEDDNIQDNNIEDELNDINATLEIRISNLNNEFFNLITNSLNNAYNNIHYNQNENNENNENSENNQISENSESNDNSEDTQYTIPCEICNNQIPFQNYEVHARRCLERRNIMSTITMSAINLQREREIIQPITNDENNEVQPNHLNYYNYGVIPNNEISEDNEENYSRVVNEVEGEIVQEEVAYSEQIIEDNEVARDIDENDERIYSYEYNIEQQNINNTESHQENNEENDTENDTENMVSSDEEMPGLVEVDDTDTDSDSINQFNNLRYVNMYSEENINNIRNRIHNSSEIYYNLPLFVNQLNNITTMLNNDNTLSLSDFNLDSVFTTLLRQDRNSNINLSNLFRPPLDIERILTDLNDLNDLKDEDNNSIECPICYEHLEKLKQDNKPVEILCGHKFCKNCIQRWFDKEEECPICKSNMREILNKKIENDLENSENIDEENLEIVD